jgi:hypothetical protein
MSYYFIYLIKMYFITLIRLTIRPLYQPPETFPKRPFFFKKLSYFYHVKLN